MTYVKPLKSYKIPSTKKKKRQNYTPFTGLGWNTISNICCTFLTRYWAKPYMYLNKTKCVKFHSYTTLDKKKNTYTFILILIQNVILILEIKALFAPYWLTSRQEMTFLLHLTASLMTIGIINVAIHTTVATKCKKVTSSF